MLQIRARHLLRRIRRKPGYSVATIVIVCVASACILCALSLSKTVSNTDIAGAHDTASLRTVRWTSQEPPPGALRKGWAGFDEQSAFPYRSFVALSKGCTACSGVAGSVPLDIGTRTEMRYRNHLVGQVVGEAVTPNYFSLLRVRGSLLLGIAFKAPEGQLPPVAISDSLWRNSFSATKHIIGSQVSIAGKLFRIIGVAPSRFTGITQSRSVDYWIPLSAARASNPEYTPLVWSMNLLIRGRSQHLSAKGRNQVKNLLARSLRTQVDGTLADFPVTIQVRTGGGYGTLNRTIGPLSLTITIVCSLIVVGALISILLLLVVRLLERRAVLNIQLVLGAPRSMLLVELISEQMLLFLAGGAAGSLLGMAATHWLDNELTLTLASISLSVPQTAFSSWTVPLVSLGCCAAGGTISAIIAGTFLMLWAEQRGGSISSRSTTQGTRLSKIANWSLVGEFTVSIVIVSVSILLIGVTQSRISANLGIDENHLTLATVPPPHALTGGKHSKELNRFYEAVQASLQRRFHNGSVSIAAMIPITSWDRALPFDWEGALPSGKTIAPMPVNFVGPGFCRTMGIAVLKGREFEKRDLAAKQLVAYLSRSAARKIYGRHDPVGHLVRFQVDTFRIIGVVNDVAYHGPGPEPSTDARIYIPYTAFVNFASGLPDSLNLAVRSRAPTSTVARAARKAAAEAIPGSTVKSVRTVTHEVEQSLAEEFITRNLAFCLSVALCFVMVLAVYGLTLQRMLQREREVAIRIAIGAQRGQLAMQLGAGFFRAFLISIALAIPFEFMARQMLRASFDFAGGQNLAAFVAACAAVAFGVFVGACGPIYRAVNAAPSEMLQRAE